MPLNIDWYRGDHILARSVADTAYAFNQIIGPSDVDLMTLPFAAPFPVKRTFIRPGEVTARTGVGAGGAGGAGAVRRGSAGPSDGMAECTQNWDVEGVDRETFLEGFNIGVSADLGCYELDESTRAGVERVAAELEAAGANIVPVDVGLELEKVTRASMAHYGALLSANILRQADGDMSKLEPYTQEFVRRTGAFAEETTLVDAAALESEIQQKLIRALDGVHVLLTATSAIEDLPAGEDFVGGIDRPDGKHDFYWEAHQVVPFNIANRLPAMSVPSGIGSAGVPTGVQIVSKPYNESCVLRTAAAIEYLMPFPRPDVG